MSRRILVVQGHPDPQPERFGVALARAYEGDARSAGHEVRTISVAELDFQLLRSKHEWETSEPVPPIRQAQEDLSWAEHLVLFYPLWLGSMPALLKGFLEQVARPGFAVPKSGAANKFKKLLAGRSARIVVTMGMPAFLYRWFFGAHSLKSLERNILGFVGIAPIRESLVGLVESPNPAGRKRWLKKMQALGRSGL